MKTYTFLTCMLLTTAAFASTPKKDHPVHVLSARMNIVHLKLDREFVGATMEVYSEAGELIAFQAITERKVLIDFSNQANGIYKIMIRKEDSQEEFDYVNFVDDNASVQALANAEPLAVVQGI